jgi:hypothetical protein
MGSFESMVAIKVVLWYNYKDKYLYEYYPTYLYYNF